LHSVPLNQPYFRSSTAAGGAGQELLQRHCLGGQPSAASCHQQQGAGVRSEAAGRLLPLLGRGDCRRKQAGAGRALPVRLPAGLGGYMDEGCNRGFEGCSIPDSRLKWVHCPGRVRPGARSACHCKRHSMHLRHVGGCGQAGCSCGIHVYQYVLHCS
jgi:hypothetical protein